MSRRINAADEKYNRDLVRVMADAKPGTIIYCPYDDGERYWSRARLTVPDDIELYGDGGTGAAEAVGIVGDGGLLVLDGNRPYIHDLTLRGLGIATSGRTKINGPTIERVFVYYAKGHGLALAGDAFCVGPRITNCLLYSCGAGAYLNHVTDARISGLEVTEAKGIALHIRKSDSTRVEATLENCGGQAGAVFEDVSNLTLTGHVENAGTQCGVYVAGCSSMAVLPMPVLETRGTKNYSAFRFVGGSRHVQMSPCQIGPSIRWAINADDDCGPIWTPKQERGEVRGRGVRVR